MKQVFFSFSFLFLFITTLFGQLTPGNMVILRVGDGSSTLNSNSRPLSLREINQSGSNVSSYDVPTTDSGSNYRMTLRGSADTEFCINLTQDATKVVFPGYVVDPGTNNPHSTSSSTIPRGLGYMDNTGAFNTSTTTTDYSALAIRGVTSYSGTNFYSTGEQNVTTTDGVRYFSTVGGSGGGSQIFDGNTRGIHISTYLGSDGNLKKVLVANGAGSVVAYGTYQDTLPTTSVSGNNFGLTTDGNIIDFLLLDGDASVTGADLLYVAYRPATDGDDVLAKYSYDGTSWTFRGSLIRTSPSSNRFYCQSINGYKNSSGNVVLFITGNTISSPGNALYTFTDTQSRTSNISSN